MELSTPEGHLLCYLPSYENLQRFHAQLDIVDRRTPNSRCRNAMLDCLNKLQPLGGFAMLAHVDAPRGFEVEVTGSSPHKVDVLCHLALLGIELKNAKSTVSYSDMIRTLGASVSARTGTTVSILARINASHGF